VIGAVFPYLIVGPATYLAMVLILLAPDKGTLAETNACELIVTVAIGSTLPSIIANQSLAHAAGRVTLGVLAGLQYRMKVASVQRPRLIRGSGHRRVGHGPA
jgi:uncharacterized membrane protein YcaP (DUF421 family)